MASQPSRAPPTSVEVSSRDASGFVYSQCHAPRAEPAKLLAIAPGWKATAFRPSPLNRRASYLVKRMFASLALP